VLSPRGDPERSVVGVNKDSVIGGRVSEHPRDRWLAVQPRELAAIDSVGAVRGLGNSNAK
jgi:hypothetical protein